MSHYSMEKLYHVTQGNHGNQRISKNLANSWLGLWGNCDTKSKRELYVKELQKYIDVDIYGKCGPLKCPDNPKVYDPRMNKECYDMLEQNYKFYLSFENIFCKDYVTEKLFNILPLQVIGKNVTLMLNRMILTKPEYYHKLNSSSETTD